MSANELLSNFDQICPSRKGFPKVRQANQNKTSTERLRLSLKKSILTPRFKGVRHIYEAFFIRKGRTHINCTRGDP